MFTGVFFRHGSPPSIFFTTLFFLCFVTHSHSNELPSLMNFKSSIQTSDPNIFTSWNLSNSPCNFTGILCNSKGFVTQINLAQKNLVGTLPFDSICKLQSLEKISLESNSLHGSITDDLKNCINLKYLDLGGNLFIGTFPEFSSLNKLEYLNLNSSGISGEIPQEFGDFKNLTELALYDNKLTGFLPQKLGSWVGMAFIDVSDNSLSGPIPPDMCKNNRIDLIALLNNSFTGSIPENYANCTSLKRFRVNKNSLSGVVPKGLWGLPKLKIFDVARNKFEGSISSDIGKAKSLAQLFLSDNQFSGELPLEISEASSLVSIQLSSNRISGRIPENIGKLKKLTSLTLNKNNLSGVIPDSIGSCVSLTDVNLAENSISGVIPTSIGSLRALNSLNLSSNILSGEIPSSLSSRTLSLLDLSNNKLFGSIPDSLAISAFKDGFMGNPRLCSQILKDFQPCSFESSSSKRLRNLVFFLVAGLMVVLVVSSAYFLFMRLKQKNKFEEQVVKTNSWNFKKYHVLNINENEIIDGIKAENVIGKGGSGNVYKVELKSGEVFAVKHIWTSNSKSDYRSSSAMLKRSSNSSEYDAEVATLSSIRHVNVVKLYCSITSEDSSLLVYESKESVLELVDSTIAKHFKEDAIKVLRIAILCTAKVPYSRPSMRKLVQMLEEVEPSAMFSNKVIVTIDG
ncbi:hypothetical protein TSUD_387900 [Trifolium subterraneum]|uniref:non-specific serine/threonine protein kinase n=1 Tax=Trifolium subterraneum TaxID=3900 RepID=A0A2Z6MPZ4_TRISU|nr:hypothetical protein TSUD_387900 [Trifolium subterraneum]